MKYLPPPGIKVTGMGIVTAIAQNVPDFTQALRDGKTAFGYLQRPGREGATPFLGAELPEIDIRSALPEHKGILRTAGWSSQVATLAVTQAWKDASLDGAIANGILERDRISLVVGGSNFEQRSQQQMWQKYRDRPQFIRPTYGLTVWDTDLVGILSQCFQIQGEGYSVGGASASGAVAIIHGARQIQSGAADVSIVVGTLFDLSSWECQGLRNLGAMGSDTFADKPELACRPFDRDHNGFVYGEGCGVLVLERADSAEARGATSYGNLLGWGLGLDGNRTSAPSQAGEAKAMRAALTMAELQAEQIDYVNPHGTSSPLGDRTEVAALKSVGLSNCLINATKSLTGHCLTGAGVVEAIATLVQMQHNFCHPTNNLVNPIDPDLNWVVDSSRSANIAYAISNSFAFAGMNASLVFSRY